ncbi:galactose oxidase [Opitutus sp. ER46]|uniref:galactose oxidase n=1 Tax=Opitutus sp. ER46 TaxID=2161864 RepID=UPI000D2FB3C4|nr:galactose oxidase [Opitutus sp. ER46]PTX94496.1 galactose oxidase [Opitutus sp. ER46]
MTLIAATVTAGLGAAAETGATSPQWVALPPVPDAIGFAGSYAGVSGDCLLVAGGANFPDRPPWENGTKTWYDSVFVLEAPQAAWRKAGRLPTAGGYGVAVNVDDGVLLVGGGDARRNFDDVWLLQLVNGEARFTSWPKLPRPLAMAAGARMGRRVYVMGGLARPDATVAERGAYVLNLDDVAHGWRALPAFPGAERMLAVAGAGEDAFYVFGGAQLVPDGAGKTRREWLRDAWRYREQDGWQRLADLPRAAVAAPSPAPLVDGRLWVIGGDDGAQVGVKPTDHKGFPRDVLAYDPARNAWTREADVPFSLVTTTATMWRGRVVIPGGEAKPGVRSPAVWATQ